MTVSNSFFLSVWHTQIVVSDSSIQQPFSRWTREHVDQGFAWRQGSVSFGTLTDGRHLIRVNVASDDVPISADAVRVIEVPFHVSARGAINIANTLDDVPFELPSGTYALRFECLAPESETVPTVRLIFIERLTPTFKIIRADPELSLHGELLCDAEPVV